MRIEAGERRSCNVAFGSGPADVIGFGKQGLGSMDSLIRSSFILGLSFLVPSLVGTVVSHYRMKFRMQQGIQLELYKIEKQGALDIGTIESNSYQTLLRGAQEWGRSSVLNLHDCALVA